MPRNLVVLYLGISPFEVSRHRSMIEAYGRRTLVVYLNPDTVRSPDPKPFQELLKALSVGRQTGVAVLSLPSLLPGARFGLISCMNKWLAIRQLTASLRSITSRPLILVVQKPGLLRPLGGLDLDLSIYEIRDHHVELARMGREPRRVVRRVERGHKTLIRQSDMVWVTSEVLADDLRRLRPDVINIGQGVDYSLFDSGRAERAPQAILEIPRPRIGVVGNLNDRIDWDLLLSIAEHRPGWQIIAIGPLFFAGSASESGLRKLQDRPNGHHIDRLPEQQLPSAISALDVCLIPYVIGPVTLRINALKLFQYLAVGKPVVATPVPSLSEFEETISICQEPHEFIDSIADALQITDSRSIVKRKSVAQRFDWQQAVDRQLGLILNRLELNSDY